MYLLLFLPWHRAAFPRIPRCRESGFGTRADRRCLRFRAPTGNGRPSARRHQQGECPLPASLTRNSGGIARPSADGRYVSSKGTKPSCRPIDSRFAAIDPHRNAVLGRRSTAEELAYIATPGRGVLTRPRATRSVATRFIRSAVVTRGGRSGHCVRFRRGRAMVRSRCVIARTDQIVPRTIPSTFLATSRLTSCCSASLRSGCLSMNARRLGNGQLR